MRVKNSAGIFMRRIKSFVKRDSRMSSAQQAAYDRLWPSFGLTIEKNFLNLEKIFARKGPKIMEIGFGSGQSLSEIAKTNPQEDYVGIEMYKPGIASLLMEIEKYSLTNIRIFHADAVEVISQCIAPDSLDVVQIFFPDPWQKRKHHKRRLIQPSFVGLLSEKLKSKGMLHLATDWEDYAVHMMRVLSESRDFINLSGGDCFAERSQQRPLITKFEERGIKVGRKIWELQFINCSR